MVQMTATVPMAPGTPGSNFEDVSAQRMAHQQQLVGQAMLAAAADSIAQSCQHQSSWAMRWLRHVMSFSRQSGAQLWPAQQSTLSWHEIAAV